MPTGEGKGHWRGRSRVPAPDTLCRRVRLASVDSEGRPMTQTEFASWLGCSAETVRLYEAGKRAPLDVFQKRLERQARALKVAPPPAST